MPGALVPLAHGFEEIEAVTVIDILRRGGIAVTTAGLGGATIQGSHGIAVTADRTLDETCSGFDAIVLPGGMPGATHLAQSRLLTDLLRDASQRGALCAAICAAPVVLAQAGLLAGKRATCYPGLEEQLTGAVISTEAVVVDATIITSRGVGTALDFALAITHYLLQDATAQQVGRAVLHPACQPA